MPYVRGEYPIRDDTNIPNLALRIGKEFDCDIKISELEPRNYVINEILEATKKYMLRHEANFQSLSEGNKRQVIEIPEAREMPLFKHKDGGGLYNAGKVWFDLIIVDKLDNLNTSLLNESIHSLGSRYNIIIGEPTYPSGFFVSLWRMEKILPTGAFYPIFSGKKTKDRRYR